jgi:S1-C subfamily serine protease
LSIYTNPVLLVCHPAGNSGGPLLDSGGCLIGINTAIYSPSGANSGVGFAIPVDVVKSSVEQIITFGKVVRPILGISFAPDQSSEQLGVKGERCLFGAACVMLPR